MNFKLLIEFFSTQIYTYWYHFIVAISNSRFIFQFIQMNYHLSHLARPNHDMKIINTILTNSFIFRFDSTGTLKRMKKVRILEPRTAQNLSILLRGSLKHIDYDEIKNFILRCDDKVLTGTIVDQLIQVSARIPNLLLFYT